MTSKAAMIVAVGTRDPALAPASAANEKAMPPPVAHAATALTLVPDRHGLLEQLRKPADPANFELQKRAYQWLARLPPEVRPMETARQYARIVNRMADLWSHCEYTRLYLQSLLVDRRSGRRGFPPEVKQELVALQRYYFENMSGLPEIIWNAVPVNPPKIPDVAFPPLPAAAEIDVPPIRYGVPDDEF